MSMNKAPLEKAPFPLNDSVFHGLHAAKGHVWELFKAIVIPYGVLLFFSNAAIFYFMGQVFSDLPSTGNINGVSLSEMFPHLGRVVGLYSILMLLSWGIVSSGMNAAYRWYLDRDLTGQIGALRFGIDELRTFGVFLVYGLLVFVLPYLVFFVVLILSIVLGMGLPKMVGGVLAVILSLASVIGMLAAMIYLSVKLSLCVPLSLQRKRITVFDSLRLTKGRGWALLGAYAIIGLAYFALMMVLSTIREIMSMGRIMPLMGDLDMMAGNSSAVFKATADMFTSPSGIVGIAVLVALSTMFMLVFLFAYTGLTSFSLKYLQKEKGDISD